MKYITDTVGRKIGVKMSVREFDSLSSDIATLRIQVCVQKELLKHKKVIMLPPQQPQSVWHPN